MQKRIEIFSFSEKRVFQTRALFFKMNFSKVGIMWRKKSLHGITDSGKMFRKQTDPRYRNASWKFAQWLEDWSSRTARRTRVVYRFVLAWIFNQAKFYFGSSWWLSGNGIMLTSDYASRQAFGPIVWTQIWGGNFWFILHQTDSLLQHVIIS